MSEGLIFIKIHYLNKEIILKPFDIFDWLQITLLYTNCNWHSCGVISITFIIIIFF